MYTILTFNKLEKILSNYYSKKYNQKIKVTVGMEFIGSTRYIYGKYNLKTKIGNKKTNIKYTISQNEISSILSEMMDNYEVTKISVSDEDIFFRYIANIELGEKKSNLNLKLKK